jgi:hypothetical protein
VRPRAGDNHGWVLIPARWWQQILHNQIALLIKRRMLFRKNAVVTDVPRRLRR